MAHIRNIMSLANTPQGQQILNSFGLTKEQAQGLLGQFLGGNSSGNNFNSSNTNNNNNNNNQHDDGPAPVDCGNDFVAICDECDDPITPDELRFRCTDCQDFDLHERCFRVRKHDAAHAFETQYATNEKCQQLSQLGNAPRDLCLDILNDTKGNFSQALERLLAVQ